MRCRRHLIKMPSTHWYVSDDNVYEARPETKPKNRTGVGAGRSVHLHQARGQHSLFAQPAGWHMMTRCRRILHRVERVRSRFTHEYTPLICFGIRMRIVFCDILTVNLGISSSGLGPEEPEVEIFLPHASQGASSRKKSNSRRTRATIQRWTNTLPSRRLH